MQVERDQVKTLLVVALIVAVFVGGVWFPMSRKRAALRDELKQLDADVRTGRTATVGLTALGHQIVLLEDEVKDSDKYVPAQPDLASLLRQWTTQLKQGGATDEEIQTQPVVRGDEFSLIPIKLKFRGSFDTVYDFLQYVEGMNRLSRFTELEVEGSPEKPGEPVTVRIELSTFYAPAEATN